MESKQEADLDAEPEAITENAGGADPSLGPPLTEQEQKARLAIERDPNDSEAWNILATEAQARSVEKPSTADLWEFILAANPTAGRWWKMYVEGYIAAGRDDVVKSIFGRCLLTVPDLGLWRCYLSFIRRSREGEGLEGREDVRKAMEFALAHIGLDMGAGPIWTEYIALLKTAPEESGGTLALRSAYQRAVVAPLSGIEGVWKEYGEWENCVSKALTKGLLAEYLPRYQAGRAVARERKKLWEAIEWGGPPIPPAHSLKGEQQRQAWVRLLEFEKSNPLRLGEGGVVRSVTFAYDQALLFLRLHPHVWYDYATWLIHHNAPDPALRVFRNAIKALPHCLLLHFAMAEAEEMRGHVKEARECYEGLLANTETAIPLAHIQMMRFLRRTEGAEAARKSFLAVRNLPACTHHVVTASALMEFGLNKDAKVARNIFELGLKKFILEPEFVNEYADFLGRTNDERNLRALFERALSVLPSHLSSAVWSKYADCERLYGDLNSQLQLEQRRREACRGEGEEVVPPPTLQSVAARYAFRSLWPCLPAHLPPPTPAHHQEKEEKEEEEEEEKEAGIVWPEVGEMAIYDPRQGLGGPVGEERALPSANPPLSPTLLHGLPPSLLTFILRLPPVPGPYPGVDALMASLLGMVSPPPPTTKRKDPPEEGAGVDIFRARQMQKSRQAGQGGGTLSGTISGSSQ